jgi:hypothetical protein
MWRLRLPPCGDIATHPSTASFASRVPVADAVQRGAAGRRLRCYPAKGPVTGGNVEQMHGTGGALAELRALDPASLQARYDARDIEA